MLGAIIGDIVGSRFEFNNYRNKNFDLFSTNCFVTDDSIMTLAVARAIMACDGDMEKLGVQTVKAMQETGRKYPNCGFGGMFNRWIFDNDPKPYNSFGNGAAMRVSPCGFIAKTEDEAKLLSRKITEVTHNHPEGIKGAEAVTVAIFLAKSGATKKEIRERIEMDYYTLGFTLDEIRETYQFDETCQGTVPQAIEAFLEAVSFEDAIRNAISIGGDSDTLAAITGSIAEAYYGIHGALEKAAMKFLDAELYGIYRAWKKQVKTIYQPQKLKILTKYSGKLSGQDVLMDFVEEFCIFSEIHGEYGLKNYSNILEKNGLEWSEQFMRGADTTELDECAVLALIMGVLRADHFSGGVLDSFNNDGTLDKWLKRLKAIDDERKIEPDTPDLINLKIDIEGNARKESLEIKPAGLVIREYIGTFGEILHQYEFSKGISVDVCEEMLNGVKGVLAAEGWIDAKDAPRFGTYTYTLSAMYADGSKVEHFGMYDRVHIPERPWLDVISTIHVFLNGFMFGDIVNLRGFMNAMKPGEVKYCGVEYSENGSTYHYRTNDLSIGVGDVVIVPVGNENYEREATVVSAEFCRWDNTPYPLEKTKQIIRKANDEMPAMPRLFLPDDVIIEAQDDGDDAD